MDATNTIVLNGNHKMLRAYGTGANPLIKASDSWISGTVLVNFWGNAVEVGNMFIESIDLDNNNGKVGTGYFAYTKPVTSYTPNAAGNIHDITIVNSHINIDVSGNPVVFTGEGPEVRVSFWNVGFDHGTAKGRQGLYIAGQKFLAVMGGYFVGGEGSFIVDHSIYPNGFDNMLFRWIDFHPVIKKNFCIDTNTNNNSYTLIDSIMCRGHGNGVDVSNAYNNHNNFFDEFIVQNSVFTDLRINGQGNGVLAFSVGRITVRDNTFYDLPGSAVTIYDTKVNALVYRNKLFDVGMSSFPKGSSGEFKDNIMVHSSTRSYLILYYINSSNWVFDYNQYWTPNMKTLFWDPGSGYYNLSSWQALGFDINSILQDPKWINPAKGDFSTINACGNGIINGNEECDDGNLINQDGCSKTCKNEIQPPICGNEIIETGEECDGNTQVCIDNQGYSGTQNCKNNCKGFDNQCQITESCGDGIINGNEECDEGNDDNKNICLPNCKKKKNVDIKTLFDGGETTHIEQLLDLKKVQLKLEILGKGKIKFLQEINFHEKNNTIKNTEVGERIVNNVELTETSIIINTEEMTELNQSAEITFYGVTLERPYILQDGNKCSETICQIISYNQTSGELTFSVTHFTNYTIIEEPEETITPPVGDNNPSGGSGGGWGVVVRDQVTEQENITPNEDISGNNEETINEETIVEEKEIVNESSNNTIRIILILASIVALIILIMIIIILKKLLRNNKLKNLIKKIN
ncbi:hypothetical protein COU61_05095 [Candidatus Pacearchaeota archaeon CG10_big_fil_rev_8_21_14_0_10_35_13]|nr:MAG: hypothetical protein COU61_05095 [Candidatus Pacearchaeota archaeon CG10_big_fil_rev_8_21_14_0_10_35_13]